MRSSPPTPTRRLLGTKSNSGERPLARRVDQQRGLVEFEQAGAVVVIVEAAS
jgi:hypothetical protein